MTMISHDGAGAALGLLGGHLPEVGHAASRRAGVAPHLLGAGEGLQVSLAWSGHR